MSHPSSSTPEKPIQQRVQDAIAQLNKSERGHAAAVRFRDLLDADDGYALGLDGENWQALETLVRGCRLGLGPNIRDALPKE